MNLNTPMVSVIVPIYNVRQYIDKCLESIVGQTFKDLEIILVDDGSTDGSGEVCDAWARREPRIRVCHKQNGGLVSARKTGVAAARGNYIAHVDADDWIEPEMYEQMVKWAMESSADVVTSGILRDYKNHTVVENEGFPQGIYSGDRLQRDYWPNVIATDSFFRTNVNIHITNKLFKREIALKHQMKLSNQIRLMEDGAVVYPAVFDAACVAVTGQAFYHYVIHENSMMSQSGRDVGIGYIRKIFEDIASQRSTLIPNIRRQLDRVLLYARLFAEPEQVFETNGQILYPFENLKNGDKVIIYGAGRFGCKAFEYLKRTGKCSVTAWCDKASKDGVVRPEEALNHDFDRIIIAVLLSEIAEQIEMELMDKGVKNEQICKIGMMENV